MPATEPAGTCEATQLAQSEDLQEAWAELTAAAKGSKVMNFHACTHSGVPWGQDPAAVRLLAAILREHPADAGE
ncbi:hypothetical protein [Arthrobacter sp. NPDC093139]|uniref:hypothetical protein n=1 Tax=Arthrobacter sp. NPDC093139 TaxID=3363945 RepID=UPI0037FD8452